MMGYREVARCARCGTFVDAQVFSRSTCPKCQQDAPRLCPVHIFRSVGALRVLQTDHGTGLTQGRGQRVPALRGPHQLGTGNHRGRGPPASGATGQSGAPSSSARKAFDDLFKI